MDEDSLVINTSGRQRMLSEQTFRLAGELVASEDPSDTQALKEQLGASLSLMRESHERLAGDVQNSDKASRWDLDLQSAYFEGASPLDARLRAYFTALSTLLETPAEALSSQVTAYRYIAQAHRDGLLRDLDQVVQIYEGKAQANLEASERLHVILMLATLALLLFMALFVFRPLIRRQVQANDELLKARDEARAELAARTSILAAVSHEIRTPLGGVLGIIDQLKHERSPVERERALLLIEDSCEVLLDTLDAILRQSRLGEGAEDFSENLFSPRAVAHRVAELFRPVARRKALRIEVNSATDRKARGDDGRIQQILANLVSNSVKFTQSGAITIYVQEPGSGTNEWAFIVADTGAGIDKKRVESLFEPFGHSSDDTLGRAKGAGLGLSITSDLVEAMGGR
ncbi:MAG: ATP-binding protein, partial [Pseudomonadota bacterium]